MSSPSSTRRVQKPNPFLRRAARGRAVVRADDVMVSMAVSLPIGLAPIAVHPVAGLRTAVLHTRYRLNLNLRLRRRFPPQTRPRHEHHEQRERAIDRGAQPPLAHRIADEEDAPGNIDRCMEQPRSEEHTSELQSRQYLVCR